MEPKKTQWQKIFCDQSQSGLTQTEYCKQRGIAEAQFYYWKKKIVGGNRVFSAPPLEKKVLLPIKIEPTKQHGLSIELHGNEIRFSREPNPSWFARVLKEMGHA